MQAYTSFPVVIRRFAPAIFLLAVVAVPLRAQFHRVNLWTAGSGGYATYRIPGLLVTPSGTVLAYAAARRTLRSDWADADILLRRSADDGRTFSPPQRIAGVGKGTFDNPTALFDRRTGDVILLYQQNYARCWMIRSHDQGVSFSPPVDITYAVASLRPAFPWNVVAPGPTHAIQLRNGRLVVPVWLANGAIGKSGHPDHAPSFVTTLYSDDDGRTWSHGDVLSMRDPGMNNPSETDIVQLGDGRVMLNMRTASARHRRVIAYSADGATRWSTPVFEEALFDPVCNAGLVRGTIQGGPVLLFSNPDSSQAMPVGNRYPRERLTVRASRDDGKTWPVARVLDPGTAGYSDLAITRDGHILCLYESGSLNAHDADPAFLTLVRFTLRWLRSTALIQTQTGDQPL